ncbi:MAG: hypothetical protein ACLFMT_06640 [Halobacteriales archaeon]
MEGDITEVLHGYADFVARRATEEFKPSNVVDVPGLSEKRSRSIVSDTLEEMEAKQSKALQRQYDAVVSAVEDGVDEHLEDYAEWDVFYRHYEGDDDGYLDALESNMHGAVEGSRRVLDADEGDFWRGVETAFDREGASEYMDFFFRGYRTAEPYGDEIALELRVPFLGRKIRYTPESLRAFGVAEKHALDDVDRRLDGLFG